MSHSQQRKEKDCLNCGAIVQGHYCQECGQENIEPKETFWHMVTHFFYDITHFDGSFFVTVKDLLLKPAFLSKEYVKGRRKTYLHPVRMYVFTSAVFFLVFFSFFKVNEPRESENGPPVADVLIKAKEEALKKAKSKEDSTTIQMAAKVFKIDDSIAKAPHAVNKKNVKIKKGFSFSFSKDSMEYESVEQYDSLQKKLPAKERDGWFSRLITKKTISLNKRYKKNEEAIILTLIEKFLHSLPYLLFVSLPLYALFLKMLYFRRKRFYFADHGVFLIHLYVFTFLLMLVYFGLDKLNETLNWSVIDITQVLLLLIGIFYAFRAMKNFYEQGWGKTILKFILFNILSLITVTFLFILFLVLSFYQV